MKVAAMRRERKLGWRGVVASLVVAGAAAVGGTGEAYATAYNVALAGAATIDTSLDTNNARATGVALNNTGGYISVYAVDTVTLNTLSRLTIGGDGSGLASISNLSGSGGLTVNLTNSTDVFTLTGINTYTGTTVLTSGTLVFDHTANQTLSSVVSGAGNLIKSGSGTLTLSGNNTYQGGTTLNAGGIAIGNANALGTGVLTVTGDATLAKTVATAFTVANAIVINDAKTLNVSVAGTNALTLSGLISGKGTLEKTGVTQLTLSNVNNSAGGFATTVTVGTLSVTNETNVGGGTFTLNGGTLAVTGTTFDKNIALTANSTISNAAAVSSNGVISGDGGLTKTGVGLLTLSGNSTYTGGTTISTGAVVAGHQNALGVGLVTVNVADGLRFAAGTTAVTIGGLTGTDATKLESADAAAVALTVGNAQNLSSTYNSIISGSGSLIKTGTGTLTLTATNSYAGGTTVNQGTLQVTSDANVGTGAVTLNNATLAITGSGVTFDKDIALTANSTISNAANVSSNGIISGSGGLTKTDGGMLTLSGVNTYAGATAVSDGTLALSNGGSIAQSSGVALVAGSTFSVAGITDSTTIHALSGAGGTVALGDKKLTVGDATSTSFAGNITGTGTFTKTGAGMLTLSGNSSTFAGTFAHNVGGLTMDSASIGGTYTQASGTTLTTTGTAALGTATFSGGSIINLGTALGTNTITATGAVTFSGATTINVNSNTNGIYTLIAGTNITGANNASVVNAATLTNQRTGRQDTATEINYKIFDTIATSLTWTGAANGNWNTSDINWKDGGGYNMSFAGGDSVTFDATGVNKSITVAASGVSVDAMTISGGYSFSGGAITASGAVNVTGGSLGLDITTTAPMIIADSVNFNGNALNITGYTPGEIGEYPPAGNIQTVIESNSAIVGFNPLVTVANQITTDFLAASAALSADGKDVIVETRLSWYSTNPLEKAQGNFTISPASSTFTLGAALDDTTTNLADGWDGTKLTKLGAGTLILTAANTYTGGTTVSAGTLQIGNGGTTGSVAGNVTNNATLAFNRSDAVEFGGVISGSGSLTQSGTGTLTLSGANTYTGGTIVNAGTLSVTSDANVGTGAVALNNATLAITGNNVTFNRNIALGAGGGTISNANAVSIANAITGTSMLTKDGVGTLTLLGANTYSGGTTVSAGTLQIGNGGTTGSVAGNVTNNATLAFNRSDAVAFSGVISGTGSVVKDGANTLTLLGENTYSGGTTVSAGTLQIGNGGTTGSVAGNVTNNATLAFNRSDAVAFGGVISGTGTVVKDGVGTLALSGTNTYSGGTTVSAGTLQIGNGGTTGSVAGNITNNATLAFNRSDAVAFGGVISGTGSVVKDGANTLTLLGANTYSGGTTVSAGTLQIGNGGTTGSVAGNVTNNATLAFNRSDAVAFSGVISGTGSVVKDGVGTLALSGANTYTGGTLLNVGTVLVGNNSAFGVGGITLGGAATIGKTAASGALAIANAIDAAGYGLTLNNADTTNAFTLTGGFTNAVALEKTGAGTVILSGANTYTGEIAVSDGKLNLASGTLIVTAEAEADRANATITIANGSELSVSNTASLQVLLHNTAVLPVKLNDSLKFYFTTVDTGTFNSNGTSTVVLPVLSKLFGTTYAANDQFITVRRKMTCELFPLVSKSVADSLNGYSSGTNPLIDNILNDTVSNSEHVEFAYNAAGVGGVALHTLQASQAMMGAVQRHYTDSSFVNLQDYEVTRGQTGVARQSLWAMPIISHLDASGIRSGGLNYSFASDQYGCLIGYEASEGRSKWGVVGTLGGGQTVTPGAGTHTNVKSFLGGVGIYSTVAGACFDTNSQFSWVGSDNKLTQRQAADRLDATIGGGAFFLGFGLERPARSSQFHFTPTAGLEYTCVYQQGFTTTATPLAGGATTDAFNAGFGTGHLLTFPLGVKGSYTCQHRTGSLVPDAAVRFIPNVGDHWLSYNSTPIGAPSAELRSAIADRMAADANIGLMWRTGRFETGVRYAGLVSERITNHNFGFLVRSEW